VNLPDVPTTKILAIGRLNVERDQIKPVMRDEVPQTVSLYLNGKIDQWFDRQDQPGVVFVLNVPTIEEARSLLEDLPLGQKGMMSFEFIPLGPLKQLAVLMSMAKGVS
jgi:hypothetical protein